MATIKHNKVMANTSNVSNLQLLLEIQNACSYIEGFLKSGYIAIMNVSLYSTALHSTTTATTGKPPINKGMKIGCYTLHIDIGLFVIFKRENKGYL